MKPKFERHKKFTRYLVSETGEVWDEICKVFVIPSLNNSGYFHVTIYDENNKRHWTPIHKLVADIFVTRPSRYNVNEKLTVNHKNGQKSDNCSDNLEWCTDEENKRHAGLMGLTSKFLPIEIKSVETDKILKFNSFVECAKHLQVSKDAISWRVKNGPAMVHDGYQYRRIHGNQGLPWPDPVSKDVIVRNLITGKDIIFSTSREAAEFTDVCEATICNWLKKKEQPVLLNKYQLQWAGHAKPWRIPLKEELELVRQKSSLFVEVRNPLTQERRVYVSGLECCKAMRLNPTALSYRLKHGSPGKVYSDGFSYSYFSHSKE